MVKSRGSTEKNEFTILKQPKRIKYDREYSEFELAFDEPIWMFVAVWGDGVASSLAKYPTIKDFFDSLQQKFVFSIQDDIVKLSHCGICSYGEKFKFERISNYEAYLIFGLPLMRTVFTLDGQLPYFAQITTKEFQKRSRKAKLLSLPTD